MRYGIAIAAFLIGSNVWAEADVCLVRPDLCDSAPAKTTQQKRVQQQRRAQAQRRQAVAAVAQTRAVRPTASRAKTQNCRPKGAAFSLNTADLPVCNSEASVDADDALYENERNPMKDVIVQPARAASRSPASSISVDAYLMANANHPAFANRSGSRQIAFERTEKPAVMIMNSPDGGVGLREDTPAPSNQGH